MICPVCGSPREEGKDICQTDWCRFDFTSHKQSPDAKAPEETIFNPKLTPSFKNGDTIADKYLIRKILGRGGMGSVYQVSPMGIDITYGLKVLHPALAQDRELVERFKQEVIKGVSLDHPNIIRVHEYHEWQGYHFFTMQYLQGQSLDRLLKSKGEKIPPLGFDTSVRIMDQILSALSHAHEHGIIHRDIKPANIMVMEEGPDIQVKVLDFGIARALSPSRFEKSAQAEGSFFYVAPEQSKGIVDARSDLFSAGALFYQMLTGDVPAGFPMLPSDLVPGIPLAIDDFLKKALAPLSQRFQTAQEMGKSLAREALKQKAWKTPDRQNLDRENRERENLNQKNRNKTVPKQLKQDRAARKKTMREETAKDRAAMEKNIWEQAAGPGRTDPGMAADRNIRANGLGMRFVYIEPGQFMMGSPVDDPVGSGGRQFEVRLTKGFYLQTTAVTQGQWTAVMGRNPSYFGNGGPDCPVESVSWEDAQVFIENMNSRDSGLVYRLPTEAEWEYACRAGSPDRFCFGDSERELGAYAWYFDNSGAQPHPVAAKKPNAWGLYDMHGNVWEWCADWFGEYPAGAVIDPAGPSSGGRRVNRGGCWGNRARLCRSEERGRDKPGFKYRSLGLRLAGETKTASR